MSPSRQQIRDQNAMARAWATWSAMTPEEQDAEKLRSRALNSAAAAIAPILEREGLDTVAAGTLATAAVEAFERVIATRSAAG